MNLGVETLTADSEWHYIPMFQHSLMNLGVETNPIVLSGVQAAKFQHSLMNLGVETIASGAGFVKVNAVSAFSDESWGGDLISCGYAPRPSIGFSIL